MIIVISPAKNLDYTPASDDLLQSKPQFSADIKELSGVTRGLSRLDLSNLMGISEKLADLNYERFQAFKPTGKPLSAKQAILAFNGDVYRGLDAGSLSENDLEYAQDHLRILSGFYGLLRPMDMMQPYRLEMGTRLSTERGKSLYDFWGGKIAKSLKKDLAKLNANTLINLASNEYFKAVDVKTLDTDIITPIFKEEKDGQARVLGLFAKQARGMMARWIIENRVETPDCLKKFKVGGYKFNASLSSEKDWVFTRPQPAKKAA